MAPGAVIDGSHTNGTNGHSKSQTKSANESRYHAASSQDAMTAEAQYAAHNCMYLL